MDAFPILNVTKTDADVAAHLRQDHNWALPDAFQAALAVQHDLHLATRNTRDFDPGVHPFVIVPYRL
jgi:predicted nucleic acid-binding protein